MSKKKYVVRPGWVRSLYDRDRHFIDANALMRLYRVKPCDCVVCDCRYPSTFLEKDFRGLIVLIPRNDGNYTLDE